MSLIGQFSVWINQIYQGTFQNKIVYSKTLIVQEKLEEGDLCPFCKNDRLHWQPKDNNCLCGHPPHPAPCFNCEEAELACPRCIYVIGELTDEQLMNNELDSSDSP